MGREPRGKGRRSAVKYKDLAVTSTGEKPSFERHLSWGHGKGGSMSQRLRTRIQVYHRINNAIFLFLQPGYPADPFPTSRGKKKGDGKKSPTAQCGGRSRKRVGNMTYKQYRVAMVPCLAEI